MKEERKYWVKDGMLFNLETMRTKIQLFQYDIEEGLMESVELMGETMDYDRLEEFKQEIETLHDTVWWNGKKATGKEYGRIKAISDERDLMRYETCLASGMSESDAGYAFMG